MKLAVVCAGGPKEEVVNLTKFPVEETVFIGADRGALHLLMEGIVPQEAVGDFDSVSKEEYAKIQSAVKIMDEFLTEKNETDTELAVERALSYQPEQVVLTGVTGGRLDHMAAALQLLYRLQMDHPQISFKICNRQNELTILQPAEHQIIYNESLPYVSFFAFEGTVRGLTLSGFKYETIDETLELGMTRFTSNELATSVSTISFLEGICLMVRSSDA
ncbi:thiamine diphosphokinase [Sporosarcina ureilytica]|uniref:Thiamine diphosphokinase n=1 Tax=Sporosarcina ureilytica TaxID=298596 RepID=A0A1D8JHW6_9BACL|nr:thiamine diphosphokinase [Sporosarcina ureilytica]AOV08305.1 thiamine diphosphokinase [Sporosarcina ureilytica]